MVVETGAGTTRVRDAGAMQVPDNPNPALPKLGQTELEQLRRRFLSAIAAGEGKVAMRFESVRLCAINGWNPTRASDLIGIPESAVNFYLNAYIAHGLDGLGLSPPGGEGFYG